MEKNIPEEIPQDIEGIPTPVVPTAFPQIPGLKTIAGKYLRRVLSQEEYDLYRDTWNNWFKSHPEWDKPEDLDDVHTICMETVVMFRLQKAQQEKPTLDISESYNQSFKRKQLARTNLTARRVDRVGTKASGGGGSTFNIAVMAGEVTQEMQDKRRRARVIEDQEDIKFLEGTVVNVQQTVKESKEG